MTQEAIAHMFCNAIKDIASKPENLANLENYLAGHFEQWLRLYAGTPIDLASEMRLFANIELK